MRVVESADFGPLGFRWLTLKRITWEDPMGRTRFWEVAERTTRRGDVDGVAILAKILRVGQPPQTIVISQFRPPLNNTCLELPAGLVDAGETAAEAAVRELREETGFTAARVTGVTSICMSDPGMSNANMKYVSLEVDGDAPENQGASQALEDGEFISVHIVPWDGLLTFLQRTQEERGWDVDARLLSFAWGLHHAQQQQQQQQVAPAAAAGNPAGPCVAGAACAARCSGSASGGSGAGGGRAAGAAEAAEPPGPRLSQ